MVLPGKRTGVPNPVYAPVLTVEVTEVKRFLYSDPTSFDVPVSL